MKKYLKIIIILVVLIVLSLIIDLVCIFIISRPIFTIQLNKDNEFNQVYKGIFFDTYNCLEYSIPQIKRKGVKFACGTSNMNIGKVLEIVDTTKNKNNFSCAEALEEFYEDTTYKYYYSCIKSKYVIVKYESGFKETVSSALKNKNIEIEDLDRYNIDYVKYEKDEIE